MSYEIKQKQFCRLTGLTRKALLVYEEKELLLPHRIDTSTGYRFYNMSDIQRGLKISFLRSLSFSVQDIQILVDETENGALLLQHKEIELTRELQRVRHGLQFIELNKNYPFPLSDELRRTTLSLFQVAAIEGRGEARDIVLHHKLLKRQLIETGVRTGETSGTYYFKDSQKDEFHFKVFIQIESEWAQNTGSFNIEQFGTPNFSFLRHYGSYELLPERYEILYEQLRELEIPITGEYLELYQNYAEKSFGIDTTTLITDIGVPSWT